jgi:hypothetical protein
VLNHSISGLRKFQRRFLSNRPQQEDRISLLKRSLPIGLRKREIHFNAGVPGLLCAAAVPDRFCQKNHVTSVEAG